MADTNDGWTKWADAYEEVAEREKAMATGTKIRCEYCGRVYKEPATGIIACPACGGPYGMDVDEPMHEYYRTGTQTGRKYVTVASTGMFLDTDAAGWYST